MYVYIRIFTSYWYYKLFLLVYFGFTLAVLRVAPCFALLVMFVGPYIAKGINTLLGKRLYLCAISPQSGIFNMSSLLNSIHSF